MAHGLPKRCLQGAASQAAGRESQRTELWSSRQRGNRSSHCCCRGRRLQKQSSRTRTTPKRLATTLMHRAVLQLGSTEEAEGTRSKKSSENSLESGCCLLRGAREGLGDLCPWGGACHGCAKDSYSQRVHIHYYYGIRPYKRPSHQGPGDLIP